MSDKLSDESLSCPFCGCTDISEGEVLTDNPDGGASTQSMCRGCGALGPDAHLREGEVDFGSVKSTAAWNRRASPAPAITMPPLNDAMRAVLTNENCIYGTPDELYAALVMAAPAIPAAHWQPIETAPKETELLGWRADCGVMLIMYTSFDRFATEQECEETDEVTLFQKDWFGSVLECGLERLEGSEKPTHWMPLPVDPTDATLKAAPAISESEPVFKVGDHVCMKHPSIYPDFGVVEQITHPGGLRVRSSVTGKLVTFLTRDTELDRYAAIDAARKGEKS